MRITFALLPSVVMSRRRAFRTRMIRSQRSQCRTRPVCPTVDTSSKQPIRTAVTTVRFTFRRNRYAAYSNKCELPHVKNASFMLELPRLKHAVERQQRCRATHCESRIVVERLPSGVIWRGKVEVFEISGRAGSDRCYAWIDETGKRRRYITHLRAGPVHSAQSAVQVEFAKRPASEELPER